MSAPAGPAPDALPPSLAARVDAVCNQFEAAWKDGRRPHIEDFLGGWEGPERSALLRELLPLDAYYRRGAGETCRPEDYQTRFPELDQKWLADALAGSTFDLPAEAAPAAAAGRTNVEPAIASASHFRSSSGKRAWYSSTWHVSPAPRR